MAQNISSPKTILAAVSLVFICLPSTKNLFSKEVTHEPKESKGGKQHGTLAQSVPLKTDRNISCTVIMASVVLEEHAVFHTPHRRSTMTVSMHVPTIRTLKAKKPVFCTQTFFDVQCTPGKLR